MIGIPWRRNQSAAVRGPWDKSKLPESDMFCGSCRIDSKNLPQKYCSFCRNSHLGVSACRRVKRVRSARRELCSCPQRRAVPQRPLFQKPGILFHETRYGSIKSYYPFRQLFLVTFGKRMCASAEPPTPEKSKLHERAQIFWTAMFICAFIGA